ncbi:MAG: phenylacetate--CoA ligase family protein [Chloroflexota bacterium]
MTSEMFDELIEALPTAVLRRVQDHRLRWQFRRCWDGSPFYRARFEAAGLTPDTFAGLSDLKRLPPLTLAELLRTEAQDWRVAPADWITGQNGPAGLPARFLTAGDVAHEQDRMARCRWAANVERPSDYGNVPESATLLRSGDFRRLGVPSSTGVLHIPHRPVDIPFVGAVVAYDCAQHDGYHLVEDHFLAEVVTSSGGRAIEDGEDGELVITDLVREASPLIRFRTGLQAAVNRLACQCGRTSARLKW